MAVTTPSSVWRAPGVLALALLALTGFAGYNALVSVAPLWAVRGGAGTAGAGSVNAVMLVSTVLTQFLVPRLLRVYGDGRVLCAGLLLMGIPGPAYVLSDGLPWILLLSGIRGLGFAILTVAGAAIVVRLVGPHQRGQAIGAWGLAVAVPQLTLLPASVAIADRWGFGAVFWLAGLPVLGIPAALTLGRRATSWTTGSDAPPHPDRASVLAIVHPTLVLFAITMAGGALVTFLPQFSSASISALALLLFGLVTALTRWLAGHVADRGGAAQHLIPLLLVGIVGLVVIAWAAGEHAGALLVGATLLGVAYGALQNLTLVVAFAQVDDEHLPIASAGWNVGFDLGTATGSMAMGMIVATSSFGWGYAAMALGCLAAIPFAIRSQH